MDGGDADMQDAPGRPGEEISRLEAALRQDPTSAVRYGRLADCLHAQGKLARAVEAYRQAVALEPTLAGAWWGAGCALSRLGDHASAVECLRKFVALEPAHGMALCNLGHSLLELGQADAAMEAFRKSVVHLPTDAQCPVLTNIAVAIPGSPAARNQEILQARREWGARCMPPAPTGATGSRTHVHSARPLRVGYVSAFFAKRNWMKPVWGLVNHHDRNQFEVHLFSDGSRSSIDQGYRPDARDHFYDVAALSIPELARLIQEVEIDLLVDLNGFSRPARLPLFALRPAPMQVAWFNMYATSGLDCFDCLVGDAYVSPADEEPWYTERIVRVPGCYLTFEVDYPVPEVSPAPCLKCGRITFGCMAPQYKITPQIVEAWSRILRQCPQSRLVLKNMVLGKRSGCEFVRAAFGRFSISEDRLDLDGPAEHFAFLERYNDIDLALDTFPYNGGTTTMEALWQGVPVLAFTGDRWASRISASLLQGAGLAQFVTPDLDHYVARAVALANSPDTPHLLAELRLTMRDRLQSSPVCGTAAFARDMEALYRQMWQSKFGVGSILREN
jgi:predicted O-linked N-acetylglucosamine transferase (SPINDLY family)